MCLWAAMMVNCAPPPLLRCVQGIFVTGGVSHFHFRHGGRRGDGDEIPALWKGSTEIMEGAERGNALPRRITFGGGQEDETEIGQGGGTRYEEDASSG